MVHEFTADEIAVIRERRHGWEKASAAQLALIFGTSTHVIATICRGA